LENPLLSYAQDYFIPDLEPLRDLDFAHVENAMKMKMKNRSVA
jgi:hypothetical protein